MKNYSFKNYSYFAYLFCCMPSLFAIDTGIASKGAVTEALFILQNKQKDVQEYTQSLKTMLTECLLKKSGPSHKSQKLESQELETYHCLLKCLVLPSCIKEFELLATRIGESIDDYSKEGDVKVSELNKVVDLSFLSKDKVTQEREILALICSIDLQEAQLEAKKKERARLQERILQLEVDLFSGTFEDFLASERKLRSLRRDVSRLSRLITRLKKGIVSNKKKLRAHQKTLVKINQGIYAHYDSPERVFVDQLVCFKT